MNKRPGLRKRLALELFRSIRKNRAKIHELRTLFWECTLRCNASCLHCGSDCHVSSEYPDMPVEDFLKVIDEITPYVDPHKVMITFTGGEALVRKDIEACGRELNRREYPWGIVTNGLLLNRTRLDSLLAAGMHSISISLDGFEEAHNWLRGNRRSFEAAVNAIAMLAEEKEIVWDVVTCVNQRNFKDLMLFKNFLIELGVKNWRIFTIFPVGRAAETPELQIDNGQFTDSRPVEINSIVKRLLDDYKEIFSHYKAQISLEEQGLLKITMNETLAESLISNLLKNAFIHNKEKGHVRVTIQADSLTIANTGQTVPLDSEHIFERFYQGSKKKESTGLGLAIAEAICRQYGLHISYRYQGEEHIFLLQFYLDKS